MKVKYYKKTPKCLHSNFSTNHIARKMKMNIGCYGDAYEMMKHEMERLVA
jgi:hypothetical protein